MFRNLISILKKPNIQLGKMSSGRNKNGWNDKQQSTSKQIKCIRCHILLPEDIKSIVDLKTKRP